MLNISGKLRNQSKKIAIFASGAGSNAKKIIEYFAGHQEISAGLIVCNKPGAGVLQITAEANIPVLLINKEQFFEGNGYVDELKDAAIDFIVLAGFLWKIPQTLINAYRNKIINIHPSLLPKFGGKGMYGSKVHEAVIAAGEKESGITIHYVDEQYDNGDVIFQAVCLVLENDTPDSLAARIHKLEHENYAKVVEECVRRL
jgi:phosphoribosylglycinamide formyltransferase-1